MQFAESPACFQDFGKPTHLRKKGGSVITSTKGLYDEAETQHNVEKGSLRSKRPQITVPAKVGKDFSEGDFVTYEGQQYEILDEFTDTEITTFPVIKL